SVAKRAMVQLEQVCLEQALIPGIQAGHTVAAQNPGNGVVDPRVHEQKGAFLSSQGGALEVPGELAVTVQEHVLRPLHGRVDLTEADTQRAASGLQLR